MWVQEETYLRLVLVDGNNSETALGIVQQTENFVGLFNGYDI
jgi:hypothetical protein